MRSSPEPTGEGDKQSTKSNNPFKSDVNFIKDQRTGFTVKDQTPNFDAVGETHAAFPALSEKDKSYYLKELANLNTIDAI